MLKKIVFAGTSEFGIPSLRMLAGSDEYQVALVISQPDRPKGRKLGISPSPISVTALELGLPLERPESAASPELFRLLSEISPDLIVTASYGELLSKELRNIPALGAINIHPSLLPRYRGATPIQSALRHGDTLSGITIFRMTGKMDAGPILFQKEYRVAPDDDYGSLHERFAAESATLLNELLREMNRGEVTPQPQDHSKATYTAKTGKDDQIIPWTASAVSIHNLIRSLSPVPGAYQFYRDDPLRFLKSEVTNEASNGVPGTVGKLIRNIGFTVNTGDFQLLIKSVQPAGKKVMDSWAFTLGSRITAGTTLGK